MDTMYDTFVFLDDEQIDLFEKILKKKVYSLNGMDLLEQIDSILKLMPFISVFYSGNEYHLVIADEVRKVYSSLKKTDFAQRREVYMEINLIGEAAAHLYGVLSIEDFLNVIRTHTGGKGEVDWIEDILYDLQRKPDSGFALYNENLVSEEIMDDEDFDLWITDILDERAKRPMNIIAAQDMINYCDFDHVEMTDDHKRLLAFLKENIPVGKEESYAERLLEDLNISFRYDEDINTIIEEISKAGLVFDIDKMNIMLGFVMAARNNTRLWGLNGWTPEELAKREAPGRKAAAKKAQESYANPWKPDDFLEPINTPYVNISPKIGRNDLCPCGSGKKYKNCCIPKDN
jgi:hypothetical protein